MLEAKFHFGHVCICMCAHTQASMCVLMCMLDIWCLH